MHQPPNPLAAYDLVPPITVTPLAARSNNTTQRVHTGAGEFTWREYHSHDDPTTILYEHALLTWLAGRNQSFAVPMPLPTRERPTLIYAGHAWHALFTYLPGVHPDINNLAHVEVMGAALGELHIALAVYPTTPRPGMGGYGDLGRVHPQLPDPWGVTPTSLGIPDTAEHTALIHWFREELAQLQTWIDGPYQDLPRQTIHGDYGPSNTLFTGDHMTGILDFDFAGPDARAMDVAAGWKFTVQVADPWPATTALLRGYRRWVDLTDAEAEGLPWLVRLRDAVSTTLRLGRGLARGNVLPWLPRIQGMRESVKWLETHREKLIEVVGN